MLCHPRSSARRRPAAGPGAVPRAHLSAFFLILAAEDILSSESSKDKNRAAFPFAGRVVDELREAFGTSVKVLWASENGAEIGRRSQGDFVVALPHESAASIKKRMKA